MSIRQIDRKGWSVIGMTVIGMAVSVVPVAILSFSVLIKPLETEFGWGRGAIGIALTLVCLGVAFGMPIAGRLIDRRGVFLPMAVSLVLMGVILALMPPLIQSMNIAGFYIGSAIVGFLGAPASSIAFVRVISATFDQNRGFALGVGLSGVGLGGMILPVTVATIVESHPWAHGFYFLAVLPFVVGLPVAMMLPETRARGAVAASKAPAADAGDFRAAIRGRVFWTLIVLFFFAAMTINGLQIHLPSLLSDRGLTPQLAAAGLSTLYVSAIIARVAAGYLFDHLPAAKVGAAFFFATAAGILCLALDVPPAITLLAILAVGIGSGSEGDLLAFLISRYYGMKSLGLIYGYVYAAFMAGSAAGPAVIGIAYDMNGNYNQILLVSTAILCLVTLLTLSLPAYQQEKKPPLLGEGKQASA